MNAFAIRQPSSSMAFFDAQKSTAAVWIKSNSNEGVQKTKGGGEASFSKELLRKAQPKRQGKEETRASLPNNVDHTKKARLLPF